jgi:hypothetical protein
MRSLSRRARSDPIQHVGVANPIPAQNARSRSVPPVRLTKRRTSRHRCAPRLREKSKGRHAMRREPLATSNVSSSVQDLLRSQHGSGHESRAIARIHHTDLRLCRRSVSGGRHQPGSGVRRREGHAVPSSRPQAESHAVCGQHSSDASAADRPRVIIPAAPPQRVRQHVCG